MKHEDYAPDGGVPSNERADDECERQAVVEENVSGEESGEAYIRPSKPCCAKGEDKHRYVNRELTVVESGQRR